MSRSLKKGPFVDFKLAKKVAALSLEVLKWLVVRSLSTMEKFTFQCWYQRIWLDTNSVSLAQLVSSASTEAR